MIRCEFDFEAFIADTLKAVNENEILPDKVGGGDTLEKRVQTREQLKESLKRVTTIMTVCVACGASVQMRQAAMCECEGFVCESCQRIEEEGVCGHEPVDPEQMLRAAASEMPFDPFQLSQRDIQRMNGNQLKQLREIFGLTMKSEVLKSAAEERIAFIDKLLGLAYD